MCETINTPLVSIICNTYNHENYIRQCLDGFIMQQTSFPVEILVHDDASTDGTANIVREYEQKYPDLIKPIYQRENQYSKGVKVSLTYQYPRARGKYIALCEGDDYWTDPLKLQKQVDILNKQNKYGCVYTEYMTVDTNNDECEYPPSKFYRSCSESGDIFLNLLWRNFPQTLTVFFRADLLKNDIGYPQTIIDYSLFLRLALTAEFYYMPSVTGAYRINPKGMVQSGAFAKIDMSEIRLFYCKEYIRIKELQRPLAYHMRIYKYFLSQLCNYETIIKYKGYFKEIIYNNPFLILIIPIAMIINYFTTK